MANTALVLCNPLCFLQCKYSKLSLKVLKNALLDFYDSVAISAAKQQLLNDMKDAKIAEKIPHVPERRGGEMRTANEVDDIFVLLAFMDERKLLSVLPQYVADSPENMPSLRLYDGDLKILMSLLEKLSNKLTCNGSTIAAIASSIQTLRGVSSKPVTSVNTANAHQPTSHQGVINAAVNNVPSHIIEDVGTSSATLGNTEHGKLPIGHNSVVNKPGISWAMAASTPARSRVNSDMLSAATETDDDMSDNPFIEQQSRRFKRMKRKFNSSLSPATAQDSKSVASDKHRKQLTVYGRSSDGNACITAAKKLVKKAVYCIDNIDISYAVKDIVQYVESQGITVISCFEVKPRHRRSESDWSDRKAFRLCINYDQRDKLLDPSRWPDSVVVRDWFFKSQQPAKSSHDTPVGKRQHADLNEFSTHPCANTDPDNQGNDGGVSTDPTVASAAPTDNDMDLTIITQYANNVPAGHSSSDTISTL